MHQVQLQLADQLYSQAKRRAVEAGFKSVDAFITEVLFEQFAEQTDNLDHLFTPERLAHVDRAIEQVKAGECYTMEEVRKYIGERRADWIQKHGEATNPIRPLTPLSSNTIKPR